MRQGRLSFICATLIGAVACGGGDPPLTATPAAAVASVRTPQGDDVPAEPRPILMSVRAVAVVAGQSQPLETNGELNEGDVFAYYVRLDRDAYVTVLQFLSDGSDKVLFPSAGEVRLRAGEESRIPRDEELWFEIDDSKGTEHLYLIASVKPIADSGSPLAELVGEVRRSPKAGAAVVTQEPPQPVAAPSHPRSQPGAHKVMPPHRRYPRLRAREVHIVRVQTAAGVAYRGQTSNDGLGVIHFPIRHR